MSDQQDIARQPSAEQMAAYLDGELGESERGQVEAWLRQQPAAAADIEQMGQLLHVWHEAAAPEPSPGAWHAVLNRIEEGVARPAGGAPPAWPRERPGRSWLRVALLAASVLLAVAVVRLLTPPSGSVLTQLTGLAPRPTDEGLAGEPYPVVDAAEVVIISMNPNDGEAVVIGQPLELAEIHLATHDDIQVIAKADPGVKIEEWGTPMIVDPLALAGSREP